MLTNEREKDLIELCQDLIRLKSYSGEERNVIGRMRNFCISAGYDDIHIDEYGNIIAHIKGKMPGKKILFDGHVDTIPVTNQAKWSVNPFGAQISDGKIYGRGASSMKGALSAMLLAAACFAKDTKKEFSGDIYVSGTVYEESFEGIAARKVSERVKPDFVVLGEASECNISRGQRGRAEIVVETFGVQTHSATPQKGVNAVYNMTKLIEKIRTLILTRDEFLGDGIMELTDIKSSPYPGSSVVPDYCKATYDRRLLVGETKESVLKPVLDIIKAMELEDPEFKANASYAMGKEKCYTGKIIESERFFPAWTYAEEDEFVQTALMGLKEAGLEPGMTRYPNCTNGSHYAGEAGIKTIGFGPSGVNLVHATDEFIEIEQMRKACEGYYAIAKAVMK
ncbi:MAG: peptidase [Firmicutes bacterium]|nr:peptidase [Bacillota bacterium]